METRYVIRNSSGQYLTNRVLMGWATDATDAVRWARRVEAERFAADLDGVTIEATR